MVLSTFLTYVLGAQKNRLIETVLLSTHNMCFDWEIRKLNIYYALLPRGLNSYLIALPSQSLYPYI